MDVTQPEYINITLDMSTQGYVPYTLSGEQEFISTFLVEKIYKILITVIGLIGNGITIFILTNPRNRKSSTAIYLTALAVSDIFILLFGPFCDWLEIMWKVIIREYGVSTCKLQTFMQYSSSSISSWLLAAVTIEKAISVTFPYKVHSTQTTKRTYIIISMIWIIVCAANTHFLFGMGHTYNKVCTATSEKYKNFAVFVLPWIDFSLSFAVPFLFISLGNIVIIRQLAVTRSRRKYLTNSKISKSLSVSLILVTVNVVFILCVGPIYIFSVMFPYMIDNLNSQQKVSAQDFWGPMLNGLWETNAAINMVLYILSGSKFRSEVKNLICCSKEKPNLGIFENSLIGNKIYTLSSRRKYFMKLDQTNSNSYELQTYRSYN